MSTNILKAMRVLEVRATTSGYPIGKRIEALKTLHSLLPLLVRLAEQERLLVPRLEGRKIVQDTELVMRMSWVIR